MSHFYIPIRAMVSVSLMAAALCGCAWPGGFRVDRGDTKFLSELPPGISSAWLNGSTLWIVPSKGIIIDAASTLAGQPLVLDVSGAYLKIVSPPEAISVRVNGQQTAIRIPAYQ